MALHVDRVLLVNEVDVLVVDSFLAKPTCLVHFKSAYLPLIQVAWVLVQRVEVGLSLQVLVQALEEKLALVALHLFVPVQQHRHNLLVLEVCVIGANFSESPLGVVLQVLHFYLEASWVQSLVLGRLGFGLKAHDLMVEIGEESTSHEQEHDFGHEDEQLGEHDHDVV